MVLDESVLNKTLDQNPIPGKLILQMLGSGFNLFYQQNGLPVSIGQSDFNPYLDLREKKFVQSFQSNLIVTIKKGSLFLRKVESALTTGIGQADIRGVSEDHFHGSYHRRGCGIF